MPVTTETVGGLLHDHRLRLRLSQPEAARRAGVSTRLWSEVERGDRPNVSFNTILNLLRVVGAALEPATVVGTSEPRDVPRTLSADAVEALREDVRKAAAFGVDVSLLRAGLRLTPIERVQRNDEALSFFDSISVTPGWNAPDLQGQLVIPPRRDR